jgi:hypothetical protein
VHVRVAHRPGERRLTLPLTSTASRVLAGALLAAASFNAGACRSAAPASTEEVRVEWTVEPSRPPVGPATVRFSLVDTAGRPLTGARLRVEGHMTHPGMAPVLADVRETTRGSYESSLAFTMAGDWVLVLDGRLADGRRLRRELSVPRVGADR